MDLERFNIIQKILAENDLGALLLWRPDEIVIATGYQPLWGLSFCLYPRDGHPILFIPELEPIDEIPNDIEIETFPWGVLSCSDPWKILFDKVKSKLIGLGLDQKPISYIKYLGGSTLPKMTSESPQLPNNLVESLSAVTSAGYKNIDTDLLSLYSFKTDTEIEKIRFTNGIAKIGVKTFYENLIPGKTEAEVASLVEASVQNCIGQNNVSFAKAWPLIQSGPNACYGGFYNKTSGRILQENELVMMELSICVNGYWADITRTGALGKPNAKSVEIFNLVQRAQEAALSFIHDGVSIFEVDEAARYLIRQAGYDKYYNHGLGHQVGFRYHDPGPALVPKSTNVLKSGMIITVEPGIYSKELGLGVRIEDNILVTRDGYELISDFSRELYWNN